MLTQDEIYKMHYYERIMQRKWKWIIANFVLYFCVGFVITCIIQIFQIGKIDMSIKEILVFIIGIFIPDIIFILLWFNQHKKLYKKLKQKEDQ